MNRLQNIFSLLGRHKIKTTIVLVLFAGLAVFATKSFGQTSKPQIQTQKVERGTLISTVTAGGSVQSVGSMSVTTGASGVVKTIFVKNGELVTQDQKLVELSLDQQGQQRQAQAWASYLSSKTTLDAANVTLLTLQSDMLTKWKTYMDLAQSTTYQNADGSPRKDTRVVPQFYSPYDDWLAAESKYKNQQAVIGQTQAGVSSAWTSYQLASATIVAPIAGTVHDITLAPGMIISNTTNATTNTVSSQKVAAIQNDTSPVAQFTLSEIDVVKVKEGDRATITIDALPGKTFTGRVLGIDKTGSLTSGVTTYPVTIQFDIQNNGILPNMSANASIITKRKDDVLLVPTSSVQTVNGQSMVRVSKNGTVTQNPVEIGISSDTQTEIISGLSEGDAIVTSTTTTRSTGGQTGSPFGALGGRGFGGGFGGGGRGGR